MKKIICFLLILLLSSFASAGGDWIGNGGGQDELNLYYSLFSLQKKIDQLTSFDLDPGTRQIVKDLDHFNFSSFQFKFVANSKYFENHPQLFLIKKSVIYVNKKLLTSNEKSGELMSEWKVIGYFIQAFYAENQFQPKAELFIKKMQEIQSDLFTLNFRQFGFDQLAFSILPLYDQLQIFITDRIGNHNISKQIEKNLACHNSQKSNLLSLNEIRLKFDFNEKKLKNIKVNVEFFASYLCNEQKFRSPMRIGLVFNYDQIFFEDQTTYQQWDIH